METAWGTGPLQYLQKMTKEEIEKVQCVFVQWMSHDEHKLEKTPDGIDNEVAKRERMEN